MDTSVDPLRVHHAADVVVTARGTDPAPGIAGLAKLRVAEVFTPGTPTADASEFIRSMHGP